MYIAGLNIPITEAQVLNAASWVSTALWFHACIPNASFRAKAHQESGPIKAMPPGKQGQVVTTVHGLGLFVPMAAVLFSYPLSGFYTPRWLGKTNLPLMGSRGLYMGLRLTGCIGTFIGIGITKSILKHLGAQWSAIGVRERPKIVKTGPYAYVRHPGLVMAQELLFIPMFWNWIFAPALVIVAIAFGVKKPMEEKVIEDDEEVGSAYKEYKKQVPHRVVPYIW